MKKLMFALLLLAAAPVFAAYQYVSGGSYNGGYMKFDGATSIAMNVLGSTIPTLDFGYYNLATGQMISMAGGASASFGAGDEIGFWIKDAQGKVSSSWNLEGADYQKAGYTIGSDRYVLMSGGNGVVYRYETHFNVSETAAPSGQPLPGVLASLLIGGGVIAARKLRRK